MKGLFIAFIVVQIGLDLAHSVTAFPFVHYGMFSEPVPGPDSLAMFQVTVNGKPLIQSDYRIYRWDMIMTPLNGLDRLKRTGDFAFDREKLKEYLQRFGGGALYRSMEPNLENAPDVAQRFPGWYQLYLSRLLARPVNSLKVDRCWYLYRGGRLQLLKKETCFSL
jgi:hypothetical protein